MRRACEDNSVTKFSDRASRWSGLEPLEQRTLLSLTVANPLDDISIAPNPAPATFSVSGVFDDTQTAVQIQTSQGTFDVLLDDAQTPLTVANFLQYVNGGLYNGTIIHRSEPGFVIQGGGFDSTGQLSLPRIPSWLILLDLRSLPAVRLGRKIPPPRHPLEAWRWAFYG